MARYLVVADQTLGGPELYDELRERGQRDDAEAHVIVPASYATEEPQAPTGVAAGGTTSTTPAADPGVEGGDGDARSEAFTRMKEIVARLEELGFDPVGGEVADPDPSTAVANAIDTHGPFDAVVVATPPAGAAAWIGMDLASELERTHDVPVVHVEAERTGPLE